MPQALRTVEREHGTRTRYMFGPLGSDRINGCRCESCTAANTSYQRARCGWDVSRYAKADAVIAHLVAVRARWRLSHRQVAELTGIDPTTILSLLAGEQKYVLLSTRDAITALSLDERPMPRAGMVDPAETWRLIAEMQAAGWTQKRIAMACGLGRQLQLTRTGRMLATNAAKVRELHTRLVVEGLVALLQASTLHLAHALYKARPVKRTGISVAMEAADLLDMTPADWWADAACRAPGVHPDIFWPERGESCRPAKNICMGCPVMMACREEHMGERFGVWGGLSERERRKIRKTRKVAAQAGESVAS